MKAYSIATAILAITLSAHSAWANDDEFRELDLTIDMSPSIGPLLVGGLGVTMFAVGIGLGWEADQDYDNYNDAPSDSLADDVESHALAANILMFGGGAVMVCCFVWWIIAHRNYKKRNEPRLSAMAWQIDPGPRRVGLTLEF